MPSKFAVTVQMPRGNTETIYPRALVLAGVRKYIENKRYKSAYLACRSHMVDLNILHDYAPAQFMENISLFIDQIKKIALIDEFLSRLKYDPPSGNCFPWLMTALGMRMCARLYTKIPSKLPTLVNTHPRQPTKPTADQLLHQVPVLPAKRAKSTGFAMASFLCSTTVSIRIYKILSLRTFASPPLIWMLDSSSSRSCVVRQGDLPNL